MRTGATLLGIGNLLMGVAYWETYGKVDGFTLWLAVCAVSCALIALGIVRDRDGDRIRKLDRHMAELTRATHAELERQEATVTRPDYKGRWRR